ncbi:two-component system histidine kinase PnpS [Lutispora thermophila]|uniref:histidine kinase n=1 Tax=Lutispora thermophila DSM 19022 TaxID=1122184 RepID=A0A1M6CNX4_9FIRM|nr:ATP-binding protein [Lutispora thermophila]SHI62755.1 two-component system, OmpR family, phosphate regulon sensor histidine kinase PhoR [Lutispora thermophila DSM 19022]
MGKKIFLSLLYVLLIGFAISGILSYVTIRSTYNSVVEDKLISNSLFIAELIAERLSGYGFKDMDEYIKQIRTYDDIRITLIDMQGNVLGDSDEDISKMDNHIDRPEVRKAIMGYYSLERRYSGTIRADYIYYATALTYDGQMIIVRLSMPLKDIEIITRKYLYNLLMAFIFGLAIALVIGYVSTRKIVEPLSKITQTSDEIAKGNFNVRVKIYGNDEISRLAETINNMSQQLQYYINGLNTRNKEMEAILSSVASGIIAIDNHWRILFINKKATEILDIEDKELIGRHLMFALRNHQIQKYLDDTVENKAYKETEITLNYPQERIIRLYTNPILERDGSYPIGVIIVLQDITHVRKLEKVRSEFVANVSHELKTPLTSIKGFIETLKEGAIRDEKIALRFIDIIDAEADRLVNLINETLFLSELESNKEEKAKEKIEIKSAIDEIIPLFKSKAESKGIIIEKSIKGDIGVIFGSKDRFKQMLINLVDNAVKYSNEGGKITIQGYLEESRKVIVVEDTGIGIPEEDLPRIFERFYRVDKARVRTGEGGTGLGLSIVKHIAMNFNADISVESKLGKGTKFIIRFP